ncbi:MAG: type IV pilus modification protein PilV [Gammaproteobacteria bacterium]
MSTRYGFTLFEVLIALLILSIGLLGLAALFTSGMKSNHGAYMRTQATLLAYDMADRMRANATGVANGDYDSISATPPGSHPQCATSSSTTASDCTPQQIAIFDHYQWDKELQTLLPHGQGTVAKQANSPNYLITVMWDGNQTGSANTQFQTTFRP